MTAPTAVPDTYLRIARTLGLPVAHLSHSADALQAFAGEPSPHPELDAAGDRLQDGVLRLRSVAQRRR